jgi:hypothetical protein
VFSCETHSQTGCGVVVVLVVVGGGVVVVGGRVVVVGGNVVVVGGSVVVVGGGVVVVVVGQQISLQSSGFKKKSSGRNPSVGSIYFPISCSHSDKVLYLLSLKYSPYLPNSTLLDFKRTQAHGWVDVKLKYPSPQHSDSDKHIW